MDQWKNGQTGYRVAPHPKIGGGESKGEKEKDNLYSTVLYLMRKKL